MKNNFKKTFLSLSIAVAILLSGSLTFASSFRRTTYYSPYKNTSRYTTTYNYSNTYKKNNVYNYGFTYYPKYYIRYYEYNNEKPKDTLVEKPNNPKDNKVDNNTEKPVENEKPVETEKPTENEKPIEKPTEDTKPNITDKTQAIELEVVRLVNEERKKAGLAPFTHSQELSRVARFKSQDMADKNYFSHNSPTYGDPFTMMKSFGINYRTAGENIAKGYQSAQSVVNGWMNSPGHRANILNPNFGTIGVGYVVKNGTTYWTQMFTN